MTESERKQIIALVKREVVPAIGCTEPIAVALCVAKATEVLGVKPEKINVKLSANVLKNAMGVGIPGTEMIGLPIAVALGAIVGRSAYQLEVLKDSTPEAVEQGKLFIDEKRINISLKENTAEKLYIEVACQAGEHAATAIIAGGHTTFVYVARDGDVLLDKQHAVDEEGEESSLDLNLRKVYDFALTTSLDDIRFILETARVNRAAAEQSFKGNYGHALGKMLRRTHENNIMGDSVFSKILSYTSAACDARMAGAMIPVMSNSGSGNQGISATLPVAVYAQENGKTEDELIRALMLSHLTVIYIKESLGRLSALCGCVVAATGSSCGITWLMGGGYDQVSFAVQNMIANLTGMICDGAKPSCALKVTTGVSTAVLSAMMAMENRFVTSVEGIIDEDVDQSIRNLTRIGSQGMNETDRVVLDIMTHKGC
ncbi:serine dehydratase subunit alpha family protein [Bacteroides sp.]|uniref:L-cysteine desulfidase family protein n=1 Tax=Bacteroides sp. TaxID=29523 RepID=UPI001B61CFB3|nr:L-serine ammonia-lyase, iron-sulfur-dependent, subunit alpha [Bacteroides sp.]MBP6064851.1 serine dehydratase subunit alpha family protein [Bacteroides sp.]MBP6067103.1 serine dehydratase subunit alpha family protein [Bacteroides sp.]MBP6936009.1 serine dehydratase subunit alpha family protein [Bacteroides sp.]MBP8621224.1 serine dehydratase subunit alpha family protein [Bacteroides sp.]MBP9506941.1 serine dehydratase subunit alpha family protein [Bacteroides sp.]